ncbi:hypothetical protein AVT69_gp217 [Pseudomonas phage PhiPA3]|uniref:Uncharacterized protein 219 n=1 Tax=Pseudomonas phage PhiPA3 TaxID=998086 RepID=F8SJ62_BPPA3|nr:hypothetical protein AVT69_gp217 [Pseudomonas phage PhiPA3]AEH03642.1 hypothetical protein [Pseudomonas phage PhiPA3]
MYLAGAGMNSQLIIYIVNGAYTREQIEAHSKVPFVENLSEAADQPVVFTPYTRSKVIRYRQENRINLFLTPDFDKSISMLHENHGRYFQISLLGIKDYNDNCNMVPLGIEHLNMFDETYERKMKEKR